MEELKEKYNVLSEAMKEKYKNTIKEIATKNGVDMGIGFDMLKAVARVELDPKLKEDEFYVDYAEGIELDRKELAVEYAELEEISRQILNG